MASLAKSLSNARRPIVAFAHVMFVISAIVASQATSAAQSPKTEVHVAASSQKNYVFSELPTLKIFGNDHTEDLLKALAAIKPTLPDQIKGLVDEFRGNTLTLRVPKGDHAESVNLRMSAEGQITLDGHAVETLDRKSLWPAVVTTTADRKTALKIEAQSLSQSGDGGSHYILEMATAGPKADQLYVAEAVGHRSDANADSGEYLLWTLAPSGRVIHKELLKKKERRGDPQSGTLIIPLPETEQGALVIGQFDKRSRSHQWHLFRSELGRVTPVELELEDARLCLGAILTADNHGILAVGESVDRNRMYGKLWRLDLDGKTLWNKTYKRRTLETFNDIVLADDQGGFIIAEESPKALRRSGSFGHRRRFGVASSVRS